MLSTHWPVPIASYLYSNAKETNPVLSRVFQAMRAADVLREADSGQELPKNFYASDDRLLRRIDLPEFKQLIEFFADSIQKTVGAVNAAVWPPGNVSLQLEIMGCWFQIQNGMAFHDAHTHGNCSWSGVYYVQLDEDAARTSHANLGEANGVTRFYGPYSQWQAGAHMDIGNAYLQKNSLDIHPEEGKLILFPSYLPHMAMPYQGMKDRIIVSFNAQVHASQGDQIYSFDSK
jgi:uncharacterized protein (TIGR02466 family)